MPLREVGKPPEGAVREKETAASRAEASRREEARHARQDAEDALAPMPPDTTPEQRIRVGTRATMRFHRADCADLTGVVPAERVQFPTPWAGLDAGYAPCPHCRPGPQR